MYLLKMKSMFRYDLQRNIRMSYMNTLAIIKSALFVENNH